MVNLESVYTQEARQVVVRNLERDAEWYEGEGHGITAAILRKHVASGSYKACSVETDYTRMARQSVVRNLKRDAEWHEGEGHGITAAILRTRADFLVA